MLDELFAIGPLRRADFAFALFLGARPACAPELTKAHEPAAARFGQFFAKGASSIKNAS
jgi:hypothetical protein